MRGSIKLIVLGGALIGAGVGLGWLALHRTPSSSSPADELTSDSFRLEKRMTGRDPFEVVLVRRLAVC
jgi:hypothetical protein